MVLCGFRSVFLCHTSCDRAIEVGVLNRWDSNPVRKPCRLTRTSLPFACPAGGEGASLYPDAVLLPLPSSIHKLRENVFQEHQTLKEKELETGPKASHGYGGKFGVEQDRMDKVSDRAVACVGTWCGWQSSFSESQCGVGFAECEGCSEGSSVSCPLFKLF